METTIPKYYSTKEIADACGRKRRGIHDLLRRFREQAKQEGKCEFPVAKVEGNGPTARHLYREDVAEQFIKQVLDGSLRQFRTKARTKCTHCTKLFYPTKQGQKHCPECEKKFSDPEFFKEEVADYNLTALKVLYKVLTTDRMLEKFMSLTTILLVILATITIGVLYAE